MDEPSDMVEPLYLPFGHGLLATGVAVFEGGIHGVIVRLPPEPGEVGKPIPGDRTDWPMLSVMLFPTKAQAERVHAALLNISE